MCISAVNYLFITTQGRKPHHPSLRAGDAARHPLTAAEGSGSHECYALATTVRGRQSMIPYVAADASRLCA